LGEDVKYTIRGPIVTFWVGHDSYLIRPFVVAGEERDWANYSYIIPTSLAAARKEDCEESVEFVDSE